MTNEEKARTNRVIAEAMGFDIGYPLTQMNEIFKKDTSVWVNRGVVDGAPMYRPFNPHKSWDDCWAAVDEICPEEIYFLSIVRNRKTPTTKYTVHLTIKFLSFMGFGETPKAAIVAALLKYLEVK